MTTNTAIASSTPAAEHNTEPTPPTRRQATYKDLQVGPDLGSLARTFLRQPSPWVLLVALLGALAARASAGSVGLGDVAVIAGLIAFQPFTEWLIHVGILHFRPRQIGRVRVDLHLAKEHRAHHLAPHVVALVMIPLVDLIGIAVLGQVLAWTSPTLVRTGVVVAAVLALQYEWTHYLLHSPRRFTTRRYQRLERHHRLHHFRNEHYWMGVSMTAADVVLKTNPERGAVPLSPTARTLANG